MIDRENVIKAFRVRIISDSEEFDTVEIPVDEAVQILELLKEQEAVEPEVEVLNEIDRLYRCPTCHKCFFYEKQKYCDQCGQKVKWE